MPAPSMSHSPFVSLALSRLRTAVSVCCWVVAVALLTQVLVWCFATFTEIRYESTAQKPPPSLIVNSSDRPAHNSPVIVNGSAATQPREREAAMADRTLSAANVTLERTSSIARAAGTFAFLLLMPMIIMGLLLAVSSATMGVECTTSAFICGCVLTLVVLPLGGAFGLPWNEGALVSYSLMTAAVEHAQTGAAGTLESALFYGRFAFLPLACVAAMAMIGLRFSTGVSVGITPKESMRLDPILEKEAANIKPSSLHGGRAAGAMRAAGVGAASERKPMAPAPTALVTAGEAPKRLI